MRLGTRVAVDFVNLLLSLVLVWVLGTSLFMNFKHPELTEMQVFLRIPYSVFLDFDLEEETE